MLKCVINATFYLFIYIVILTYIVSNLIAFMCEWDEFNIYCMNLKFIA